MVVASEIGGGARGPRDVRARRQRGRRRDRDRVRARGDAAVLGRARRRRVRPDPHRARRGASRSTRARPRPRRRRATCTSSPGVPEGASLVGPLAVATPGFVAGCAVALERWGIAAARRRARARDRARRAGLPDRALPRAHDRGDARARARAALPGDGAHPVPARGHAARGRAGGSSSPISPRRCGGSPRRARCAFYRGDLARRDRRGGAVARRDPHARRSRRPISR